MPRSLRLVLGRLNLTRPAAIWCLLSVELLKYPTIPKILPCQLVVCCRHTAPIQSPEDVIGPLWLETVSLHRWSYLLFCWSRPPIWSIPPNMFQEDIYTCFKRWWWWDWYIDTSFPCFTYCGQTCKIREHIPYVRKILFFDQHFLDSLQIHFHSSCKF